MPSPKPTPNPMARLVVLSGAATPVNQKNANSNGNIMMMLEISDKSIDGLCSHQEMKGRKIWDDDYLLSIDEKQ